MSSIRGALETSLRFAIRQPIVIIVFNWILRTGAWDDSGVWEDTEEWED